MSAKHLRMGNPGRLFLLGVVAVALSVSGWAEVTPNGNYTQNIPIAVSDGRADMGPELSLVYNSHAKNGFMGIGWTLSGLGAISRDSRYPVKFDGNDRYQLDGDSLKYNAGAGRYHREQEDYSLIRAFNMDTPTSYWLVQHKDGVVYTYGGTPDSHIDAIGKGGKAIAWALNRVENRSGNYYTIQYYEDTPNPSYYPIKIVYTKHDAYPVAKHHVVTFEYENRTDRWTSYAPSETRMVLRLKWIKVFAGANANGDNGQLVRQYRLDYDYSPATGVSRLTGVQEYGSDGATTKPAVAIGWQNDACTFEQGRWETRQNEFARVPAVTKTGVLNTFNKFTKIEPRSNGLYFEGLKSFSGGPLNVTGETKPPYDVWFNAEGRNGKLRMNLVRKDGNSWKNHVAELTIQNATVQPGGSGIGVLRQVKGLGDRIQFIGSRKTIDIMVTNCVVSGQTYYWPVEEDVGKDNYLDMWSGAGFIAFRWAYHGRWYDTEYIYFKSSGTTEGQTFTAEGMTVSGAGIYDPNGGISIYQVKAAGPNGLEVVTSQGSRVFTFAGGGTLLRETGYHALNSNASQLSIESGKGYLAFAWFDGTNWTGWESVNFSGQTVVPGDFNGDGKTDTATLMIHPESGNAWRNNIKVDISTGSGFTSSMWAARTPTHMYNTQSSIGDFQVIPGDFNGDGKTDLATVSRQAAPSGWRDWIAVELSTGTGFTSQSWNAATPLHMWNGGGTMANYQILSGDFNGDGKTDLATVSRQGSPSGWHDWIALELSTGTGFTSQTWNAATPTHMWNTTSTTIADFQVLSGDFNGDGKTDLATVSRQAAPSGWRDWIALELSTGTGFTSQTWNAATPLHMWNGGGTTANYRVLAGDYNGDGLTDLATISASGSGGWREWIAVELSTGTSFSSQVWNAGTTIAMTNTGPNLSDYYIVSADVNGDGRSDILTMSPQTSPNGFAAWASVELSTGVGFNWRMASGAMWDVARSRDMHMMVSGDFNGDGKTDVAKYWNDGGFMTADVFRASGQSNDLMTSITTGAGGVVRIAYTPTTQVPGAIRPDLTNYPTVAAVSAVPLATRVELDDGMGGLQVLTYEYSNCQIRRGATSADSRYLGFEYYRERKDDGSNMVQGQWRVEPYVGLFHYAAYYDATGRMYDRKAVYYGNRTDAGSPAGVAFVYPENAYNESFNGDGTCVKTRVYSEYDAYGNQKRVYNFGQVEPALSGDEQETLSEFVLDVPRWVLDRPKHVVVNGFDSDGVWGTRSEQTYYYDNQGYGSLITGLQTSGVVENGTNDATVTITHDLWGNVSTTTDPLGRVTKTVFDSEYRQFMTEQEVPALAGRSVGYKSFYYYDSLMRPERMVDYNGVVTFVRYDVFSRPYKKWVTPDTEAYPSEETTYPTAGVAPEMMTVKRRVTAGQAATVESRVWTDGLGRVVQKKTLGDSGNYITVDTYYDGLGRTAKTSSPYLTTSAAYTTRDSSKPATVFDYDAMSRPVKVTVPGGRYSRTIFGDGEKMIVDANGHVQSVVFNGLGQALEVREYSGTYPSHSLYSTTRYAYDTGLGKLCKVTDNAGNVTKIYYDMAGNKTKNVDPDMGTWQYAYALDGQLTSVRDNMGRTTYFEYDAMGRRTRVDYPSGVDSYFYYDEPGYGSSLGRLTRATYEIGQSAYWYDERGQVTQNAVTIDGIVKTQGVNYDSLGRVKTITYPDGEVVTHTYNAQGLDTLTGLTTYVSDIRYNERGNIDAMVYGNGITNFYTYYNPTTSPNNYLVQRIYTSSPTVFDLSYAYDAKGNITGKADNLDGTRSENYTYDELDRLVSANATVYGNRTYAYNAIGNITQKDGLAYAYGSARPHAVTQKGAASFGYDDNGCMTSRGGETLSYNFDGMMTGAGSRSYAYFDETRAKKVEGATTTRYFFGTYEEATTGGATTATKYYFADRKRVAERTVANGLVFYHADHLNSAMRMTNSAGVVLKAIGYKPFGLESYESGALPVKYRFTGKEKDDSNLYYYGARYYDPDLGRFTTPDTVVPDPGNPQAFNRYSYAANNPIMYIDPTGHVWESFYYDNVSREIRNANQQITALQSYLAVERMRLDFQLMMSDHYKYQARMSMNESSKTNLMRIAAETASGARSSFEISATLVASQVRDITLTTKVLTTYWLNAAKQEANMETMTHHLGVQADKARATPVSCSNPMFGELMAAGAAVAAMGTCFVAGTPVMTEAGLKAIEDVKAGDMVLSRNEVSGETTYKKVVRTFVREASDMVVVTIGSERIECTSEHPFWVVSNGVGSWVGASNLKAGDVVTTASGGTATIVSVSTNARTTKVYNFEVSDFHTYFVGTLSVLVHNRCEAGSKDEYVGKMRVYVRPGNPGHQGSAYYDPKTKTWTFVSLDNSGGTAVVVNNSPVTAAPYIGSNNGVKRFTGLSEGQLYDLAQKDGYSYFLEREVVNPNIDAVNTYRLPRNYAVIFNNCIDFTVNVGMAYGVSRDSFGRRPSNPYPADQAEATYRRGGWRKVYF